MNRPRAADARRRLYVIGWCIALGVTTATAQRADFKVSTERFVIYPSVLDERKRVVTDLTADDFQILDNGRPAAITVFSSAPQPITAVLMLDTSESMRPAVTDLREGALAFVDALAPDDRLRIGSFGMEIGFSPHLTADKTLLARVAREELWPSGSTPLWLAIDRAFESLDSETGRRAVVVVTDGKDTSRVRKPEVTARLHGGGALLYVLGLDAQGLSDEVTEVIRNTGGVHAVVARRELPAAVRHVVQQLRHQYLIGFAPGVADNREHALHVTVKRPGLSVTAPRVFVPAKR